jgi:hypothetical protein
MPVCVGSGVVTPLPGVVGVPLLLVVEDEVVVEDLAVEDVPVVVVVLENLVVVDVASSLTLPSTQYSLLVSRLGQVIPGSAESVYRPTVPNCWQGSGRYRRC